MAIKISTGLRNGLLDSASLKGLLDGGVINIYQGDEPASADSAIPEAAQLLCTVSLDSTGDGINFDINAVDGVLSKAPAEVWSGVNAASGTAQFYRHVQPSDTGVASDTEVRVQGNIGTFGTDMEISSTTLTEGAVQTVDHYSIAMPTL